MSQYLSSFLASSKVLDPLSSDCGIQVDRVIADAPKRAELRCLKQHGGYFCCDICVAMGQSYKTGISRKVVFPNSTSMFQRLRTHEEMDDLSCRLHVLDENARLGLTGRSALFNIAGFDVVSGMVPEYMHSTCIGIAQRLIQLTFVAGDKRRTLHDHRRHSTKYVDEELPRVRVPSEFSRRTRKLDLGSFKAEEYRNIVLFFFPIMVASLEDSRCEMKLWAYLSYIVRAYCLPDVEFEYVSKRDLQHYVTRFHELLQNKYGVSEMIYNMHIFHHLNYVRDQGALPTHSAFPYEGSFAELRRVLVPGTPNPAKQVIRKLYESIEFMHYRCVKQIRVRPHQTQKVDDSLFYKYDDSTGHYDFYVARTDSDQTGKLSASRVCVEPANLGLRQLDWASVGVFKMLGENEAEISMCIGDITGKAINCLGHIMTVPDSVIRETSYV